MAMRQRLFLSVTALALLGLALPATARAQYSPFPVYNPGRLGAGTGFRPYFNNTSTGPRLSPYLLLGNNPATGGFNNLPAVNYYLGVLPEIDRRNTQALFQYDIQNLNVRTAALSQVSPEAELFGGTLGPTGHGVTFLNPAPYYNTGGVARAPAAAGTPTSGSRAGTSPQGGGSEVSRYKGAPK
jgi:hypothetical protein